MTKFEDRRRKRRQVTNATVSSSLDDFDAHFDDWDESSETQIGTSTSSKYYDNTLNVPDTIYCGLLDSLEEECWESNLAELWEYDEVTIKNLTRQNILDTVNSDTIR